MSYYSREIKMPLDKREGLANFVQIIINKIEAGEIDEALLTAVDLHQDIVTGLYDAAMKDTKAEIAFAREMEAKHTADIISTAEKAREDGVREEKARVAMLLGVAA